MKIALIGNSGGIIKSDIDESALNIPSSIVVVGSGVCSTLRSGNNNTASEYGSTVSGGSNNTASNYRSTVSGGNCNTASGYYSTVSGGNCNTASGSYSFVASGTSNTASSNYSTVSGGNFNTASGNSSTVSGGNCNTASGSYSFVASGNNNNTCDFTNTFILGSGICADSENKTFVNNLSIKDISNSSSGLTLNTVYNNNGFLSLVGKESTSGVTLNYATVAEINTGTESNKVINPLSLETSKYLTNSGAKLSATATGTDTYVATITPAITGYVNTHRFWINFTNANTITNPTLSLNGLTATGFINADGSAIAIGALRGIVNIAHNGTVFQIVGTSGLGFTPENIINKNGSNGYVGLNGFSISFRNLLNTFTSLIQNSNTAVRTYMFKNRSSTIADDIDIANIQSQINTTKLNIYNLNY